MTNLRQASNTKQEVYYTPTWYWKSFAYVDSLQMDLGAQPKMFLLLLQEASRHDKCMKLDDFQNLWG